jgi:hypothetical protein
VSFPRLAWVAGPSHHDRVGTAPDHLPARTSAWYSADVATFLDRSTEEVLGALLERSDFAIDLSQRQAWTTSIALLREALAMVPGTLFLEFAVPRMGSHIDAVLIAGGAIIVIEFKVGASDFTRADTDQVWDYALDLRNFHRASHSAPIFPLLVATEAPARNRAWGAADPDGIYRPLQCSANELASAVH